LKTKKDRVKKATRDSHMTVKNRKSGEEKERVRFIIVG
jgi:hypothetical protein